MSEPPRVPFIAANKMVLIGIAVGAFYFVFDAVADALFFGAPVNFAESLLSPEPHIMYHRGVIVAMFVIFGGLAQLIVNKNVKVERVLRESWERYVDLVESTFDGILVHRRGRILEANEKLASMFGYGADELMGKYTLDLTAPESRESVAARIGSGSEEPYEAIGMRKDGSTFDMELFSRNILFQDRPARISAVRDISRRKRTEHHIQRRHEIEDVILNITSMFVGSSDLDVTIDRSLAEVGRYCGACRVRVFQFRDGGKLMDNTHEWCADGVGPEIDRLQGIPIDVFSTRMNDLEETREAGRIGDIAQSLEDLALGWDGPGSEDPGSRIEIPLYIGGRLGGLIDFENAADAGEGSADRVMLRQIYSEVLETALERHRVEKALRDSESRYKVLFEGGRDAVFIVDVETGIIADTNPQGEALLGRPRGEVVGMHYLGLNPPERAEEYEGEFQRHARGEEQGPFSVEVVTSDGGIVPMEVNTNLIELGGRRYIQGLFRDVTERKRAEQQIVSERNRAEFYLDVLSHDIIDLNRGICSCTASVATRTDIDEDARDALERVRLQAQTVTDLVSNIQRLSQLQDEGLPTEAVDITALLSLAIECVLASYEDRTIEVNFVIPEERILVRGNDMLLEVFRNILDNAVRHDPHEKAAIQVACRRTEADGKWMVRFADHGRGVPDEMKVEVFQRLEGGGRNIGGRGLGMTLVNEILKNLDGSVWVEDRTKGDPGQGSVFVVVLPAAEATGTGP